MSDLKGIPEHVTHLDLNMTKMWCWESGYGNADGVTFDHRYNSGWGTDRYLNLSVVFQDKGKPTKREVEVFAMMYPEKGSWIEFFRGLV